MKKSHISRRNFFKLSVLGAGALALPAVGLASVAAAPSKEAQASAEQPHKLSVSQPTFNPIASTTRFGPPTDLSMGWDGTLWAIDVSGAPHLYDPVQNQWNPFGEGVDAAAGFESPQNIAYFFRGPQVLQINTSTSVATLGLIADVFPKVPDSFKLGVTGAAAMMNDSQNLGGYSNKLVLFKGGWYVPADGSLPPARLIDLTGWPQTGIWAEGVVDAVFTDGININLFRGGEELVIGSIGLPRSAGIEGPISFNLFVQGIWGVTPPSWWESGIDSACVIKGQIHVFKGASTAQFGKNFSGPILPQYLAAAFPNWPSTWNPILNHAPNGRMGALWSVAKAVAGDVTGVVSVHNGEGWTTTSSTATSVSAGQDGSVFHVNPASASMWKWNGTSWDAFGSAPGSLQQVSIGDNGHIWVRDADNTVYSVTPTGTAFNANAQASGATHISANTDGTLWHCTSGSPNVRRLIPESSAPSSEIPVKNGLVTGVQKVASTGFGSAHVLVTQTGGTSAASQPQVYRYDSPYVFKTSASYSISNYGTIELGLGLLYLLVEEQPIDTADPTFFVVAVDAHTGAEVVRTAGITKMRYGGLVFDAVNELVYVGTTPTDPQDVDTTNGELLALDARTLQQVWSYTDGLMYGIDAAPALSGTTLACSDRGLGVHVFDTSNRKFTTLWRDYPHPPNGIFQNNVRMTQPLFANGRIYTVTYILQDDGDAYVYAYSANATDNSDGRTMEIGTFTKANEANLFGSSLVFPPVLGTADFALEYDGPAICVNGGNTMYVIPADFTQDVTVQIFRLPSGQISSGFAFDDGTRLGQGLSSTPDALYYKRRVWFGDTQGNLWGINLGNIQPADHTPYQFEQNTAINTTPVLYKDAQAGLTVLFGLYYPNLGIDNVPSLYGYDPDNGNVASVPTGITELVVMSKNVSNGVVYGGGVATPQDVGLPQAFGIRVDALPQLLRDFIIESQMMQDPDENAPGGDRAHDPNNADPVPPSRARYQTHLTIVDDQKQPQANEAVKIWADAPTTIQVQGQSTPYEIGPGDSQFALVKTGTDGSLVITSGYAKADGSDKPDMYVPALRVWASFMDPFERVVVNPDHEFHQRTATAHNDPNDDDPDKVNLTTTRSYAGTTNSQTPTPLFTSDEVKQGQPKNCATAIGQMRSGVGFGDGSSTNAANALFGKLMLHASGRKQAHRALRSSLGKAASTAPPKYVAYTDLPGSGYFPTNIPATRPTTVQQATGLIFSKPAQQPSTATSLQVVHHTVAQAAFDALPPATVNPPWQTNAPPSSIQRADGVYVIQGTQNIFTDFWNWLKNLVVEITDLIVTVADEVSVGIKMIVNGIEKVFKAIVKVIDDIASAIGSFFKMILKLIEDVIAALSVLFHFGEIMKTHVYIREQVNALLMQAENALTNNVKPAIDGIFTSGETAVQNAFQSLIAKVDPNKRGNTVKNSGSTPHTAFSAGPGAYGAGNGSSHAVQCSYGLQKAKANAPSGSEKTSATQAGFGINLAADDPIVTLWTNFTNEISSNSALEAALSGLGTDASNLFTSSSASSFFENLLVTLLQLLETLIEGAMVVANAFVDMVLNAVGDIISSVQSFLNTPIDIYFISWLYNLLFGEPLTFLNVISLVAAIPITILYRVIEGHYPSKDIATAASAAAEAALMTTSPKPAPAVAAVNELVTKVMGSFSAVLSLFGGIVNGVNDSLGEDSNAFLSKISAVLSLSNTAISIPIASSASPSTADWIAWGTEWIAGTVGVLGAIQWTGDLAKLWEFYSPGLTTSTSFLEILFFSVAFGDDAQFDPNTDLGFAANLLSAIPGVLNPIKLFSEAGAVFVAAVDFIGGIIVMVLDFTVAFGSEGAELPHKLHLPMFHAPSRLLDFPQAS